MKRLNAERFIDATIKALNAVKGGLRFSLAIASGDEAHADTVNARRAVCRDCPNYRITAAPGALEPSSWCGEPFVTTTKTCGCLIAGKTLVASECCPSGRWSSVPPALSVTVEGNDIGANSARPH